MFLDHLKHIHEKMRHDRIEQFVDEQLDNQDASVKGVCSIQPVLQK